MSSRRGHDSRRDDRDRDRDDHSRKQPHKESSRSKAPLLDEFWLDGEDIDRQVLQSCICRFLGPEATSRPFEHEGKPGYKIKAVRPFTPAMLQDLKDRSKDYVLENTNNQRRNQRAVPYEQSRTGQRDLPDELMDYEPTVSSSYAARGPYSQGNIPSGFETAHAHNSSSSPYATSSMYAPSQYSYAQPQPVSYTSPSQGFGAMPTYADGRYPSDYPQSSREGIPSQVAPGYGGGYPPVGGGYGEPQRRQDPIQNNYGYPQGGQFQPGGSVPRILNNDPRYHQDYMTGISGNPQYPPQPRDGGNGSYDPYRSAQTDYSQSGGARRR